MASSYNDSILDETIAAVNGTSRVVSGSSLASSGIESSASRLTMYATGAGTWGVDLEVRIGDAGWVKLSDFSNATTSAKTLGFSLNCQYRFKVTAGTNVRVLLAG